MKMLKRRVKSLSLALIAGCPLNVAERPQAQRLRSPARHLHGGWKGGARKQVP